MCFAADAGFAETGVVYYVAEFAGDGADGGECLCHGVVVLMVGMGITEVELGYYMGGRYLQ